MNKDDMLFVFGSGEVIMLDNDVLVIGFGGNFVLVVVCVMQLYVKDMSVKEVVEVVIYIVGDIDIFINYNVILEML